MEFNLINPDIRGKSEAILYELRHNICECSFVDLFIWSHKYNTSVAFDEDFMYIRANNRGKFYYLYPMGKGDIVQAVKKLETDATNFNQQLVMRGVTHDMRKQLERYFPNEFQFTENRDSADYIYLSNDLRTLAGKKLHSKRNFVNRFKKTYEGRWYARPITSDNLADVYCFQQQWRHIGNRTEEGLADENIGIELMLKNFPSLGNFGIILYVDQQVAAFSIGNRINPEMVVVQIEKANIEIPGAYQMINWLFVNSFCETITYVNREEDLGMEGLRKAKLSYHPHEIRMKHEALKKLNR